MNSLYEIGTEYLKAFESLEVDEDTGEIANFEAIDALESKFDEKAESVACYIKNLDRFAADLKAEEAAMAERRKSAEKKADSLKKYLASCMDNVGRDKVETVKARISFRKSVQVVIDEGAVLPEDFVTTTITKKPDKTAIKKAIQGGQEITGAALVTNRNIQIK